MNMRDVSYIFMTDYFLTLSVHLSSGEDWSVFSFLKDKSYSGSLGNLELSVDEMLVSERTWTIRYNATNTSHASLSFFFDNLRIKSFDLKPQPFSGAHVFGPDGIPTMIFGT